MVLRELQSRRVDLLAPQLVGLLDAALQLRAAGRRSEVAVIRGVLRATIRGASEVLTL